MNILPFVTIFLIILATLSYSCLDKSKTLAYEKTVIISHLKVDRNLLEKLHREAFRKAPRKQSASQTKPLPTANTPTHPELSPRETTLTKMNVFPLFADPCPAELRTIFLNLLKACYGHCDFFQTTLLDQQLQQLLEGILTTGREKIALYTEQKEDLSLLQLSEFYPKNPSLHSLFYKMLKGTRIYHLGEDGYPPLEEIFFFKEETTPAILHFPSLSKIMLEMVFGKEEAAAILTREIEVRSKYPDRLLKTLAKEELLALLHEKFPSQRHLDKLVEYVSFASEKPKKNKIIAFDEKTSIKIEREKF